MSIAATDRLLDEVAGLTAAARRILFATGAGLSADDGDSAPVAVLTRGEEHEGEDP